MMLEDPTAAIERIYHEMYGQLNQATARERPRRVVASL
jgi:hypothetical protein